MQPWSWLRMKLSLSLMSTMSLGKHHHLACSLMDLHMPFHSCSAVPSLHSFAPNSIHKPLCIHLATRCNQHSQDRKALLSLMLSLVLLSLVWPALAHPWQPDPLSETERRNPTSSGWCLLRCRYPGTASDRRRVVSQPKSHPPPLAPREGLDSEARPCRDARAHAATVDFLPQF